MRVIRFTIIATVLLATAMTVQGQPSTADPEALINVLRSLNAPGATETPVVNQTADGYIDFLSAPAGGLFMVPPSATKAVTSDGKAQAFLDEHKAAFGVIKADVTLPKTKTNVVDTQSYVRFAQRYRNVPVFGAEIVVQVSGDAGISAVNTSILRDTTALDSGTLSLAPGITDAQAVTAAKTIFAEGFSDVEADDITVTLNPVLEVYDPALLKRPGNLALVWRLSLMTQKEELTHYMMLVNAHTSAVELHYSLLHNALDRKIYDAAGISIGSLFTFRPGEPVRLEGEAPVGDTDVDNVYDYLGDTYSFYFTRHGRDSYDDAGSVLEALVNVGDFINAMWVGGEGFNMMVYGEGLVTDDITGHEVSHGVTQYISDLVYQGESGAINESFSDIWGEYVDLTNGRGNDSPEVRWLMGEDADCGTGVGDCIIRNMADPPEYFSPDRMGSPYWIDTNSSFDFGGVHFNSGVGNKLCYLLTDGDSFNGFTIDGMGINQTAELFYAAHQLLTQTADYNELYFALGSASSQLGLSFTQRLNIANACKAVEIVPLSSTTNGASGFRALPVTTGGMPAIALYWNNAPLNAFNENILLKSIGDYAMAPGDGVELMLSDPQDDQYLDTNVLDGVEYLYTLIVDLVEGFPQILFARAIAGDVATGMLTEAFGENLAEDPAPAFDLGYTQLLFSPVGPEKAPLGEDLSGGGSLNDYEITIEKNIPYLPVAREDADGGSILVLLTDEHIMYFGSGYAPIPLFGKNYDMWYMSSNGYVAPAPLNDWTDNWPGLASHFNIPRISLLFADLAPNIAGNAWIRHMTDRVVITYETIPEHPDAWFFNDDDAKYVANNTAQLELFYSGHIRMTYQEISANDAIVGLSDGNGVPLDPSDRFPSVDPIDFYTDLSESSETPEQMSFDITSDAPVVQMADAGDAIRFDVRTIVPPGASGVPVLTAEWDGVGPAPFIDNNNATGTFLWNSALEDSGTYTVRVKARLDDMRAYVDVTLLVGEVFPEPVASNLEISSGTPGEDPTVDHEVDLGRSLHASYDYSHVWETLDPLLYEEGESVIYWWRNNQMLEAFTGSTSIPAVATADGDIWRFSIIPISEFGIPGQEVSSATVTINGDPIITSVLPPRGLVEGGATVQIRGMRLDAPIAIDFGGIAITEFTSLGYDAIELVTPSHGEGYISVSVTTAAGTATAENIFKYVTDPADLLKEDVNLDGKVDAVDVQLVTNAILQLKGAKDIYSTDVNLDGATNVADVQCVISKALYRK